jgi:DNA invertase Pin-like site-specific DNA recombinase
MICNQFMYVGYARVSTDDQHLDTQLQVLKQAGCKRIFQEKVSGARRQRPELAKMLEHLREGDTVVVWKLDRLARSTRDLLEIADTIDKAGAGLKSLSEPWADTTSPSGRMVLTVFAGIAEFERELIKERTSTGRIAALKRGVRFGRPARLTAEQTALAKRLLEEGNSAKEVAKTFGVHKATIYRTISLNSSFSENLIRFLG